MAGPGAIAAQFCWPGQARDAVDFAALLGVIGVVCALTLLVFCFAGAIKRAFGVTGNIVSSRLLGIILAALAVQYVIDGDRTTLKSP